MVKVMAICPDFSDATSFYRGAWPISRLQRLGKKDISIHFQQTGKDHTLGWGELSEYDVLFIQRPYTSWNADLLLLAREIGLKTWIDYDDNLYNVPFHNPAFMTYGDPKVKARIAQIIKDADLVTFSTEHLKETMAFDHSNAHVIRNSTDFELVENQKADLKVPTIDKTIFWRGSRTHDNDLFLHAEVLKKIALKAPDWRFIFLGKPWYGLTNYIPKNQFIVLPPVSLPKYFGFIRTIRPKMAIVPLEDTPFNRSKSNIAWQECTIAGCATIVPNWPEWNEEGAVTYDDCDSLYAKMDEMMRSEKNRERMAERSYSTLKNRFDLRHTTFDRAVLLRKLIGDA